MKGQAQTEKVLFVGNSYTGVNNLPQLVKDAALSVGDTLLYDAHTPGGNRLFQHAANPVVMQKIFADTWDHVVLQCQSQEAAFPIQQVQMDVFPAAKTLCDTMRVNEPCTRPIFYMTWGRKNGDQPNCPFFPPLCTYEGMDSLLNLRYRIMAEDNDAFVSPVGAVWHYIRDNYPHIELYQPDESHPSQAGSYAAACTFYSIIFEKDPTAITYQYTLADSIADQIRAAAKAVAFDSLMKWNVGKYRPIADFTIVQTADTFQFQQQAINAGSYHWDFGDSTTSTDPSPVHIFQQGGTYTITLVVESCGQFDTLSQSVNFTPTALDESIILPNIILFPNPMGDSFSLEVPGTHRIKDLVVFDTQGKKIGHLELGGNQQVDASDLQQGVYLLEIQFDNGQRVVRKVWKQ